MSKVELLSNELFSVGILGESGVGHAFDADKGDGLEIPAGLSVRN